MIHRTAIRSVPCGERGTELSRKLTEGLRLQLFCAVLLSLLVGLVFFGGSFFAGNFLLNKTVYGEAYAKKMSSRQFSNLQKYVEDETISPNNLQRLNAWCSRGEKVYLTIYLDDMLIYESHRSSEKNAALDEQEFDPNIEDPENEYILTLHGDIKARAFLYYYAGDAFYFGIIVLSGLLAFIAFSGCFVMLVGKKVAYISQLKEELDVLSGGQLECPVTIIGADELGELALGIDQMRRSIKKHNEMENQMRSANSELITAMSHDLRTPLTSLLAYLEIIERKKHTDEEQLYQLVRKSIDQTMRIKTMADQLFEYFLVYATEWEPAEMEIVDADPFFQQILEDYVCALECRGMNVELRFIPTSAKVAINTDLLRRAMDNLYSNLQKYADPTDGIWICYEAEEDNVCITFHNGVRSDRNKKESTGIGLNTCKRVIAQQGGSFSAEDDGQNFGATVRLPLI